MMMINFDDYSAYQLHNAVVFSYSAVNNEFESAVTETCVHGAHGSKLWMGNKQTDIRFCGHLAYYSLAYYLRQVGYIFAFICLSVSRITKIVNEYW